jgi:nitrous oxidase accessory protein NosD
LRRKSLAVAATSLAAVAVLLIFALAALQVIPLLPKAEPRTLFVPDNYASIQEAVDDANAGDTVFVHTGTYPNSNIFINASISLVGQDSQKTIVRGGISIIASGVTVSGFTVEPEPPSDRSGILIGKDVSDIKITGNNVNGFYRGIATGSSQTNQNLEISDNNVTNTDIGMNIEVSKGIISNNRLINNTSYGMVLDYCRDVTVKQNKIAGSELGLFLRWTGPFFVYENNVTECAVGVEFGARFGDSVVHNNNIARNQIGILLSNQTDEGVGNKVYYNNVFDNYDNVVVEPGPTDEVSWDNGVVGNYWSDYSGQGEYVIDENNVDHHPLTQKVDISIAAPESSSETYVPLYSPLPQLDLTALAIATAAVIVYLWRKK